MIENSNMETESLDSIFGLLRKNNLFGDHNKINDIGNGVISMTGGYTFSLIWSKKQYFYLILIVGIQMVPLLKMVVQLLCLSSLFVTYNVTSKLSIPDNSPTFKMYIQYELQYVKVKKNTCSSTVILNSIYKKL